MAKPHLVASSCAKKSASMSCSYRKGHRATRALGVATVDFSLPFFRFRAEARGVEPEPDGAPGGRLMIIIIKDRKILEDRHHKIKRENE